MSKIPVSPDGGRATPEDVLKAASQLIQTASSAGVTVLCYGSWPETGDRRDDKRTQFGGGTIHDRRSNVGAFTSLFSSTIKAYSIVDLVMHEAVLAASNAFEAVLKANNVGIKEIDGPK